MKRPLILLLIISALFIVSCDMIDTSMFEGEPDIFTISFDSDGGSDVPPTQTYDGYIAKRPQNPTKEGWFFEGWYNEDGDKWSFTNNVVTSDLTLYASWIPLYTVAFESNIGSKPDLQFVGKDRYASQPTITASGYMIEGWYLDEEKWDFKSNPVTEDITLTANWVRLVKITLDDTVMEILPNSALPYVPNPIKEGAYFLGWYKPLGKGRFERVTTETTFEEDTTLTPRWEENESVVLVALDANGGKLHSDFTLFNKEKGEKIGDLPEPFAPIGARFVGWFDENDVRYSKGTTVLDSITLKAKYQYKTECTVNEDKNHRYTTWSYNLNSPSCTEDVYAERYCMDCQIKEIQYISDAYGHSYDESWSYELMKQTRACLECGEKQTIEYIRLEDIVDNVKIEGEVYGLDNTDCLFNGDFTETDKTTFCGKNNGAVTVFVDLNKAITVDNIFLKGEGNHTYTVYVMWEGSYQYTPVGIGYFGEIMTRIDVNARITSIKIQMDESGTGTGFWQELIIAQIPAY